MVAEIELDNEAIVECNSVWIEAAVAASDYAEILGAANLHKQTASRILEPFLWHTSVISATSFDNCFSQRIHADAQPEFKILAEEMKNAIDNSIPELKQVGEWHTPYVLDSEKKSLSLELQLQISVARVARSSYLNQNNSDIQADLNLYDRLVSAQPPHLSPFEMVATPDDKATLGNYDGWTQLRHLITTEQ
jgi:thymidylate synthase ThyX